MFFCHLFSSRVSLRGNCLERVCRNDASGISPRATPLFRAHGGALSHPTVVTNISHIYQPIPTQPSHIQPNPSQSTSDCQVFRFDFAVSGWVFSPFLAVFCYQCLPRSLGNLPASALSTWTIRLTPGENMPPATPAKADWSTKAFCFSRLISIRTYPFCF